MPTKRQRPECVAVITLFPSYEIDTLGRAGFEVVLPRELDR